MANLTSKCLDGNLKHNHYLLPFALVIITTIHCICLGLETVFKGTLGKRVPEGGGSSGEGPVPRGPVIVPGVSSEGAEQWKLRPW